MRLGRLPSWRFDTSADDGKVASSLAANGIVAIQGFLPPDVLDPMAAFAEQVEHRVRAIDERPHVADDLVLDEYADGYSERRADGRAFAFVRTGADDDGLIEVAHIDQLDGFDQAWTRWLHSRRLIDIAETAAGVRYESQMVNLYLNDSITGTRSWHFDDPVPTAKVFYYLTDVTESGDGPYCYARGTHQMAFSRNVGRAMNKARRTYGNAPPFRSGRAVEVLGTAGTVVISFQNGFHRGAPQAVGHTRRLVMHSLVPYGAAQTSSVSGPKSPSADEGPE